MVKGKKVKGMERAATTKEVFGGNKSGKYGGKYKVDT